MNRNRSKAAILNIRPERAVIYCRVSSQQQVTQGSGLDSQETRCRSYAASKKYEVVEVFKEEGVSGARLDRPALKNLLFLSLYYSQ